MYRICTVQSWLSHLVVHAGLGCGLMDLDGGDLGGLLVAQAACLLDHLDGECQNAATGTMVNGLKWFKMVNGLKI